MFYNFRYIVLMELFLSKISGFNISYADLKKIKSNISTMFVANITIEQ